MTDQQKLEALIQKALDGGWNDKWKSFEVFEDGHLITYSDGFSVKSLWWSEIIINHDFAKALWGDPGHIVVQYLTPSSDPVTRNVSDWQYHLQQMVIADDPIDYAYQSVFGETHD